MLAHAKDVNVSDDDEFPRVYTEYRIIGHLVDVLGVALSEELKRLGVSVWRLCKTLASRVLADCADDLAGGGCYADLGEGGRFFVRYSARIWLWSRYRGRDCLPEN